MYATSSNVLSIEYSAIILATLYVTVFLGAHHEKKEFSKTLDEVLPFSAHYKYWIKPEHLSSFTERLKNFFFENNPHYITKNDLLSLNKVSTFYSE